MDDTARELRAFQKELQRFNDTLSGSVKSLEREHSTLTSLWNDSFRREYDKRWAQFGSNIKSYLQRDAGRYNSFLTQKVRQVEAYLRG